MKRFVPVLFVFFTLISINQNLQGQCSSTTCVVPTPALSAPEACILCSLADLENFSYSTSPIPNLTTWPTAFCSGVQNNQWYAFVAPQASVTFNFTVWNCQNDPVVGLQAEVYSAPNCSNNMTSVSNCWSPGIEVNGTVTAAGMIPGNVYYLMMDGYDGDVCNYTINILDPPGGVVPPATETADICIPGTVICAGQVFSSPGVFPVSLQTANGCDSIVNCVINPIPPIPPTNVQAEFCAPAVYEVCGNFYSSGGFYTTVCTASDGCDSTVITDLAIMETMADVAPPDELGCDSNTQVVTLDASASTFSIGLGVNVEFSWDGPGICGPTNELFACVDAPGTYCFTVSLERNGVVCDDVMCVDVVANLAVPPTPDLSGADEVCDPSMETYSVQPFGTPLPDGYTWTTPNGEPFTDNGDTIIVDWTGSLGGDLCVSADNDCGSSDSLACITIVINAGSENPSLSGEDMVCDGDSETYTVDNPDTSATYLWSVPIGAFFIDNDTSITVDFSGAMSGDVCVEAINDCDTSDQFCLPVTLLNVLIEPVFSSGDDLLCDGMTETYCITVVPGATSYTWDTPAGNFPGESECFQIDWTGSGGGEVCVTADNDCGSSPSTCITVTLDEGPTAAISGGGSFCENSGDSIDLSIDFTGTGPWTFTYNDGLNPDITETTSDNPHTLNVNAAGTYILTGVDDVTDCPGTISGEATVTENSTPTASLVGNGAICAGSGSMVDLTIDLSGAQNWIVDWTLDGSPQTALSIANSPFTFSVSESQAGDIALIGVTDGNNCVGTASGNSMVTVVNAPEVSAISTVCDGTNTSFTVEFTISGGDAASYSITPNSGTLNGNVFTSEPISSGMGYSFSVTDINDCSPVTVEQNAVICDCASAVGTMDSDSIEECSDGPITANYDPMNENLDADDVLVFILHEGNDSSIVNEIARNDMPSFGFFSTSMTYGTTYYISAVVANNDGSGTVNLSDPCAAVSVGTAVTFFEIPTATLSGTQSICAGECADLTMNFTGEAPYSIMLNDGNLDIDISGINSNLFNYQVCPTVTTNYSFTQVNNENCIGAGSGIATITANQDPVISNENVTINANNTGYTVTFEITGGDPNSYVISPDNGTLNGNIYTTNEIPCGNPYTFSVDDTNACGPSVISSPPVSCDCVSEAGDMDTESLSVCGNGSIQATYLGGEVLDGNDALCYMIHIGDEVPISVNDEPVFTFDQLSMTYGTSYFVCAVVGDDNGNACVDFGDNCLSIGTCTEVVFNEIPTALISGGGDICVGETVDITIDFSGNGPWEFTYNSSQGSPVTVSGISENPYQFSVNPNVTTTYQLTEISDINCTGTTNGNAVINVETPPSVTSVTETCNSTNTAYTISFQINAGDPTSYTVTPPNGNIDANGIFTSDEIPSGMGYQFFIDDANACGPIEISNSIFVCECETWSGTISPLSAINECGDGPVSIPHEGNEILDSDDILNFFIHTGDYLPLMVSPDGNFTFDDSILDYEVLYEVCAVAGNNDGSGQVDFSDPCLSISACRTINFHALPTATLSGDQAICENENAELTIDFTGTGPFSITYESTNGGQITESGINSNPYTLSIPVPQSDVFSLIIVSDLWCDGTVGGTADVQVTNAPDFDLTTLAYDCDPNNFEYSVSVEIMGGDPATYVMSGMSGIFNGNVFKSDPISGLMPYQFFLDDQFGCGPNELSDDSPIPTGTISGENTICLGDETTVTFSLSGEGPYDIEYLDENGILQNLTTDQMVADIDISPTQTSTITLIAVTNSNTGCGHSPNESISITVNTEPNAGIANEPFRICEGVPNVTDLNNLLNNADPGGQWFNSLGNIVSSNFNTEPQSAGVYEFTYTVPGLPPCNNDSEMVNIIIDELPLVEAGDGGALTCDNTSVNIGEAPNPGFSYSWSLAGLPFPGDSTQAQVDVNLPGDYTLTVTIDSTGCMNADVVTVVQDSEQPSAEILTLPVQCFGENNGFISVQSVTGGVGPYMYAFNGGSFTDQTTYLDLGPGEYTIVVQDTKGCMQTFNFEIAEPEELNVSISGEFENNENLIDLGDSLLLKLEVSVPFGALDVVNWYPPELIDCDSCESTWTYPTFQTEFSVSIEKDGCTAEGEITVFVNKNRPVYIPNSFAPGGDGHPANDRFRIYSGAQVARVRSFQVFTRWGEIVFEAKDFDPKDSGNLNTGWDGTFRGEAMDAGVFVWFAEIEFIDGEVEIYEGDVVLFR